MQKIKHSQLSLGNQAYQELKRFILERQIPPGGKLNEGDLASALGISRTPVREAINRLEKEGLVEIFPQRGALSSPVFSKRHLRAFFDPGKPGGSGRLPGRGEYQRTFPGQAGGLPSGVRGALQRKRYPPIRPRRFQVSSDDCHAFRCPAAD